MRYIAVVAASFLFAVPASATTPISGGVGIGARAVLGDSDNEDSQSFALDPMALGSLFARADITTRQGPTYTARAFGSVHGVWNSADSGYVSMDWGWQNRSGGSQLFALTETNRISPNWTYTFTATGNGVFHGRYNVNGFGFGVQPLFGADDFSGVYGGDVNDPTGFGSFSKTLVSGQTYTMSLYNNGNVSSEGGMDNNGSATSLVTWDITYRGAVPEPAPWALMIGGLGLAGGALRGRRALQA